MMDRYQESSPGIREIGGDQMTNTTTVICARKVGWVRERGGAPLHILSGEPKTLQRWRILTTQADDSHWGCWAFGEFYEGKQESRQDEVRQCLIGTVNISWLIIAGELKIL